MQKDSRRRVNVAIHALFYSIWHLKEDEEKVQCMLMYAIAYSLKFFYRAIIMQSVTVESESINRCGFSYATAIF